MTTPCDVLDLPADVEDLVASLLHPGGIRTVFQPVVRVADGVIIGYEALSRSTTMPHLSPAAWLEAADAVGRRLEVELACMAAVSDAGDPPDRALIFLNASPDVAVDPRFAELCGALPRHVIEVTEHVAVEDYEPLLEGLRALRAGGSLVAVDDVGAGYASMSHVLQLSPSFIKLDRSLVSGLDGDPRRRALVEALQAFAAASGALTIAEGVETEAELRALSAAGIDLVQGYLLARPQEPWVEVSAQARNVLLPEPGAPEALEPEQLAAALDGARTPTEACELVSRYLSHQGGLLPSVYLERGGVLRCQSRRGQWLVMDGLRPGAGISGTAFAEGCEILSTDVASDPRYRLAVPGVSSEMAVPLTVAGRVVGVLNVDALAPILPRHVEVVRLCGRLLEARLEELDASGSPSAILHDLSRLMPTLAVAGSAEALVDATLAAVAELTGFDAGCVWSFDDDGALDVAGTIGDGAAGLTGLPDAQVLALRDLVADLASCYSGGTDLSLAVPPTHVLRERGARGVVLVPIRDGWDLTDMLVLTSGARSFVAPDVVDAVEALCLQAGSRLAALRRVAELEDLLAAQR
ncbi:EAL domain-containing protein [Actinotalea sp. BY-33]|uniref:EAL domain-containing protein n=1 Tax=Actinotalea soli TaxID=2819234 RepID=A0A939LR30_9CELL|nr:EAL domain-containing protein [Actinotalea soli]MBO1751475.1 EAL domain-containing protein [Actinotalea soli]